MKHRVPVFAKVLLAAGGITAALLTAPPVAGQNQKESFTGFAINMNGGPRKTRRDRFHDRALVHRRRARSAAHYPA